ncbi:hypothetical protein J2785_000966 [Burkholderia ambifaria]|nr:hypothetical protein [Burkholderia ambifaria]MDR6497823.1 hypothetical protein [Burkholderia ambifaria]
MKKTADHWLAAEQRTAVEAALKRLRGAADAARRKAGWIAEANPYYFTILTIAFRVSDNRRQTECLRRSTRRTAMVPTKPIISRLNHDDATLYSPRPKPRKIAYHPISIPTRHSARKATPIATRLHRQQTLSTPKGCAVIATDRHLIPTCFPSLDRHF